jgi:hypothetical protein
MESAYLNTTVAPRTTFLPTATLRPDMASEPAAVGTVSDRSRTLGFGFFFAA